jgi:hypothetical protein
LHKTIEIPLEEANMVRSSRVDEARWLLAVDSLLKVAIKEGILHVQLAHEPTSWSGMLRTVRMVAGLTTRLNVSS